MSIQFPASVTSQISRRAIEIAQVLSPRKTGRGSSALLPTSGEGYAGIEVPDSVSYMYYLNQGIEPHRMSGLLDRKGVEAPTRVIPIRQPNGSIVFRTVNKDKVGQPKIITRLPADGRLSTQKMQWVYPHKDPMDFLSQSLVLSVEEWKKTLTAESLKQILYQTELKDDLILLFGGLL